MQMAAKNLNPSVNTSLLKNLLDARAGATGSGAAKLLETVLADKASNIPMNKQSDNLMPQNLNEVVNDQVSHNKNLVIQL